MKGVCKTKASVFHLYFFASFVRPMPGGITFPHSLQLYGKYFAYNKKREFLFSCPVSVTNMGKSEAVCSRFVGKNVAVFLTCGVCNDGKCSNCKLYNTVMLRVRACRFFPFIFFRWNIFFFSFLFFELW